MEKWSHKSLEWIHEIREANYKETKEMLPYQILKNVQENSDDLLRTLGLKIISPPQQEYRKSTFSVK